MSTVIEQIEQQIAKLSTKAVRKNTGIIRTVADGVAKIDGLSDVAYNEMIQFPGGVIGIALNLGADEVGAVVLGDVSQLKEGDEVSTTGKLLSVPVGKALLGRTVDALGNPVDGKGRSVPPRPTRSRRSPPASWPASRFPSRSSPASRPSTP